jgi:hypothetical protein
MSQNETTPDELPEDVSDDGGNNSGQLEQNLKRRSTWVRLLFMIAFVAIYMVTRIVFGAVVVFQFLWFLFTAETNKQLTQLGQSLATYTYQIMRYLSFNSEDKPFPFNAEWPTGSPDD